VNIETLNLPFASFFYSFHMLEPFAASDLGRCCSALWVATDGIREDEPGGTFGRVISANARGSEFDHVRSSNGAQVDAVGMVHCRRDGRMR
jgi:hypothetical protein